MSNIVDFVDLTHPFSRKFKISDLLLDLNCRFTLTTEDEIKVVNYEEYPVFPPDMFDIFGRSWLYYAKRVDDYIMTKSDHLQRDYMNNTPIQYRFLYDYIYNVRWNTPLE